MEPQYALNYLKEHNHNFDFSELLRLEQAKIKDLMEKQETRPDCQDKRRVIRSMKWCIDLLDYMCEQKEIPSKVNLCSKNDTVLKIHLNAIEKHPCYRDIFTGHYYRAKASRLYYLLRAFYTRIWWY